MSWFFERPVLILVLTTVFWGGNVIAGKLAIGHVDPFTLTVLRWTGALLFVLPFALREIRHDRAVLLRSFPLLLFYGAVGFATFNFLLYFAVLHTSAMNVSIEQVAVGIFVMLGNFLVFRVRARLLQLVGVALTILGVVITATHGDLLRILSLDINVGDGLMILASLGYAIYSLTLRYRPAIGWRSFMVASFLGATIAALGYQLALGGGFADLAADLYAMSPRGWAIALYVIVFPSIISQMLYVRGVELIGPNRASLFINLIPFFGTLGSILVLGEQLEGFHVIAGILIIAGIVLAEWSARRIGGPPPAPPSGSKDRSVVPGPA